MEIEKLYYNGIIHTMDKNNSVCNSIGVSKGKIVYAGDYEKCKCDKIGEKIDLGGKLVFPGFTDTHLHTLEYAEQKQAVNLFGVKSVEEIINRCKKHYEKNGLSKGWLVGNGWNQNDFTDGNDFIYREDLDKISKDFPIVILRACVHVAVGNSKAMEIIREHESGNKMAGYIDFEKGILREGAVTLYKKIVPKPDMEYIQKLILSAHEDFLKAGITQVHSADLFSVVSEDQWKELLAAYKDLEEKGKLKVKTYEQCMFFNYETFEEFVDAGYRTGQGTEKFTLGPLKIIADGSLGARTAYLIDPYSDDSSTRGILNLSEEEIRKFFKKAKETKMQIAIHTIGDGAAEIAVRLLNEFNKDDLSNPMRDGLVHAQILNDEIIDEMVRGNITAYIQPVFIDDDLHITKARLGEKREKTSYIWKTLTDKGILLSGGSDAPVVSFNILENIYFAVARKTKDGKPEGGWYPKEKLSIDEAVRVFTVNAAYHAFQEDIKGTLEVGKCADMAVLDRNIYNISEDEIKDVNVDITIVDGEIVFKR